MSRLDNVIVHVAIFDQDLAIEAFGPIQGEQALRLITGDDPTTGTWIPNHWGGSKESEVTLWAAAFNHLGWPPLFERIESVDWELPSMVQLLIRTQEGNHFGVYELDDGHLRPANIEAAIQQVTLGPPDSPVDERYGRAAWSGDVDVLLARAAALLGRDPESVERDIRSRL